MTNTSLERFLTPDQLELARTIGTNHARLVREVVRPNLAEIEAKLGEPLGPDHVAWVIGRQLLECPPHADELLALLDSITSWDAIERLQGGDVVARDAVARPWALRLFERRERGAACHDGAALHLQRWTLLVLQTPALRAACQRAVARVGA